MEIRNLASTSIPTITEVFNTAFKVYYVPINFTEEGMHFRIQRGRIDLRLSTGVFDGEQLVAFMLSGVDDWHGQATIYNAGTGVLPAYRGQQWVDQMYEWALPLWREEGYTQATLEVIVENARAIRVYERIGMHIDRKLISLKSLELTYQANEDSSQFSVQEVKKPNWTTYSPLRAFNASWDFCESGVDAVLNTCRYFELWDNHNSTIRAYAIINDKGQVAQAGIHHELNEGWFVLINELSQFYSQLSWINIDERSDQLLAQLTQQKWTGIIDQYEMKMKI